MNDTHNRRLRKGKASTHFVWRNQTWTVEDAQKLLTEDELEKSQNEASSKSIPFCSSGALLKLTIFRHAYTESPVWS